MINTNYNMQSQTFTGSAKVSVKKLEQYMQEGLPIKEIARRFNVSESTIYYWLNNFNLSKKHARNSAKINGILENYSGTNMNVAEISRQTGLSEYAVRKWFKEHYSVSLHETRIKKLKMLLQTNLTNKEIAQHLQMNINAVKSARMRYKLGSFKRKKENMLEIIAGKLKEGFSKKQIAEFMKISCATVQRYAKLLKNGEQI